MQHFYDTLISPVGTPVVGASVSIFVTGTQTKATIYSDDGVTVKTNPITTDSLGRFDFYVADGKYDLQITGPGLTTVTRNKVEIADITEGFQTGDNPAILSLSGTPTYSSVTLGIGNGAGTNITAPAKSTGTGPASLVAVEWEQISVNGTIYWRPLFQ